jgi:photosystem II stability/assembly factor-like uncharacterized protein
MATKTARRVTKRVARKPARKVSRKPVGRPAAASKRVELLLGTIKGAFVLTGDGARRTWRASGPFFLGCEANHIVRDPRDGRTLLLAAKTGHLGPTVFRSSDEGATWKEAQVPPAFPKGTEPGKGPAVERTFYLAPGHASQPGVWWAGTIPHALFRSADHGETWSPVDGFNSYIAMLKEKAPTQFGETPGGAITHSILIDPRDARHMYVSLSTAGFFESTDGAATWRPMNAGSEACFFPEKFPEYGQDPHCVVMSPANPDRLYQQNHCGVYRLDRPGTRWERIGKNLPEDIGDIGFAVVAHPRNPDTLWVFPMDGTTVWPRTSPAGKPAVYRSTNGGKSWTRQDKGFPRENGWFTVFRQAMKADTLDPVGLYAGTTSGELWASRDGGGSWKQIASHLPRILSLEVALK